MDFNLTVIKWDWTNGPLAKASKQRFWDHRALKLQTCQNMKCSLMMVFTASLLQTSLFRHWQAKSWTFWMLIISHLFSNCPQSFACQHKPHTHTQKKKSSRILRIRERCNWQSVSMDGDPKFRPQLDEEHMSFSNNNPWLLWWVNSFGAYSHYTSLFHTYCECGSSRRGTPCIKLPAAYSCPSIEGPPGFPTVILTLTI